MKRISIFVLLFLSLSSFVFSQQRLVLLSGVTMRFAVEEITQRFSETHDVEFEISYGGSGNLKNLIQDNRVGDLFFPGSDSYIEQLRDTGEVVQSVFVGENKATMVVAKGNPSGIQNLADLADMNFLVVLARADSGSIGREAAKILESAGIIDEVMANALYLTTDSKDLDAAIKNGDADVTINWKATSTWPENRDYMDSIPIEIASPKRLVFGLLKYSKNPQLAEEFMKFASSPEGKAIFEKNGF